ncbi:hypothetical protein, partial [Psychrobacillus psychrotolerans]|uniref:hypothetical protein n=1 Tax=Psychrobacillus psychrotolerans TaxID=126156 RepID=UPI00331510D6
KLLSCVRFRIAFFSKSKILIFMGVEDEQSNKKAKFNLLLFFLVLSHFFTNIHIYNCSIINCREDDGLIPSVFIPESQKVAIYLLKNDEIKRSAST